MKVKYNPDNIMAKMYGWTEDDFTDIQAMLYGVKSSNNIPATSSEMKAYIDKETRKKEMNIELGDVFEYGTQELIVYETSASNNWIKFITHIKGSVIYNHNEFEKEMVIKFFTYKGKAKHLPSEWFKTKEQDDEL